MIKIAKYILLLVIAVMCVFFAVANRQVVDLHILNYVVSLELYILLFICIVVGVLVTGLISLPNKIGAFFKLQGAKRRIKALEGEISTLNIDKTIKNSALALKDDAEK